MSSQEHLSVRPRIRVSELGFFLPEPPLPIADLPLTPDEAKRLPRLAQEITFVSKDDSTTMMIHAARDALARSGVDPLSISLVISAPTLITSYGLEIPGVAVCAALGLKRAQCINLAQGCIGVLRGIELASKMLIAEPERGDIMVVTSCRASAFTRNMNHGAFFWADAAAAVIVTNRPGPGLEVVAYSERAAREEWGAMRIDFGDADGKKAGLPDEGLIRVAFQGAEGQITYIRGEQERFAALVDELLASEGFLATDLDSLFLPSTGKNRIPILFSAHRELRAFLRTDLRYGHMGGVDPIFGIAQRFEAAPPPSGAGLMLVSPAFAAQWGGLLLRYRKD